MGAFSSPPELCAFCSASAANSPTVDPRASSVCAPPPWERSPNCSLHSRTRPGPLCASPLPHSSYTGLLTPDPPASRPQALVHPRRASFVCTSPLLLVGKFHEGGDHTPNDRSSPSIYGRRPRNTLPTFTSEIILDKLQKHPLLPSCYSRRHKLGTGGRTKKSALVRHS